MGKNKKPFIDKDKSQKFHLFHRSYNDAAYAKEETPSEFVLIPAEPVRFLYSNIAYKAKANIIFVEL